MDGAPRHRGNCCASGELEHRLARQAPPHLATAFVEPQKSSLENPRNLSRFVHGTREFSHDGDSPVGDEIYPSGRLRTPSAAAQRSLELLHLLFLACLWLVHGLFLLWNALSGQCTEVK